MEPERAAFLTDDAVRIGAHVALSEADARHAGVLRLNVGDRVALRDGAGTAASGLLVRLGRSQALVEVDLVQQIEPAPPVHLLVPIADRDRMLWLAEKVAELNVASWRPVLWQRSRSVSPRGDGAAFRGRVAQRMIGALLQSRSAWLPEIFPDATPDRAIAAAPLGARIALDLSGTAMGTIVMNHPISIAVGPEGGFEDTELSALRAGGFSVAALGTSVLRFETAAIAAIAVARSMLTSPPMPSRDSVS